MKNWPGQTGVEKQLEDVIFSVCLLCWQSIIGSPSDLDLNTGLVSSPVLHMAHWGWGDGNYRQLIWHNSNLLRQRARWYWDSILVVLVMFIYSGGVVTIHITVNTNTCLGYLLIILKIHRNWWRRRRRRRGRGRRIKRKVTMRMLFSHHEVKYPRPCEEIKHPGKLNFLLETCYVVTPDIVWIFI